jgi:hypothetical protein
MGTEDYAENEFRNAEVQSGGFPKIGTHTIFSERVPGAHLQMPKSI